MSDAMAALEFVSESTRAALREMPDDVRRDIGFALSFAQAGLTPADAKPLKGFGGASVMEIVAADGQGTYRSVYTVKFKGVVYVLHCFQKKSKTGIATPKQEIDLIKARLKQAELLYKERKP